MNVVFDLGGVVVAWKPDEIVAAVTEDPSLQRIATREIMQHPDWLALDRGTLSVANAIARAVARSGLAESLVQQLIEHVPPALVANPETVALMRAVKSAGHELFCLSNMPHHSIEYLERRYDFWDVFTGTVISARIGYCKPEPEIYRHLLERYRLVPAETVFIDDMPPNLDAAAAFGIRTIRFETVAQCADALRALGCL